MDIATNSADTERANALRIIEAFERGDGHMDQLLERYPVGRKQALVVSVFRNWLVLDWLIAELCKTKVRRRLQALLRMGMSEIHARPDAQPAIVHATVEWGRTLGFSRAERGFVNALLRCGGERMAQLNGAERARLNHPHWLRQRWSAAFGEAALELLLQWNQQPPEIYVHCMQQPGYAIATAWDSMYALKPGELAAAAADLKDGLATVCDPLALLPVAMLAPQPGETIIDLCAAPGGKSRLIAQRMAGAGLLVCVDKSAARLQRLRDNLQPFAAVARVLHCTAEDLDSAAHNHPIALARGMADGVLLDAPCSNTGVIRRRPDVRLRLSPAAIADCAAQQRQLLATAAQWIRPGGRMVYSTCSIEAVENELQIEDFLARYPDWRCEQMQLSRPWEHAHDGGIACLLRRCC